MWWKECNIGRVDWPIFKVLIGRIKRKRLFGSHRCAWKNNIKNGFEGDRARLFEVDWSGSGYDLVASSFLQVPENTVNFLNR
jgi:hypothetical protein